jgi:hypothetical protein
MLKQSRQFIGWIALLLWINTMQLEAGSVIRQFYTNITGTTVFDLQNDPSFPNNPGGSQTLTAFLEGSLNYADNYGSYIRGYIEAPQTGQYTFWIASDDDSELHLSTDATPDTKSVIAFINGYTGSREWTKYPDTQVSAPITLAKGQKYYFEVYQKDGTGDDNVAVGWQLPDGVMERPIQGYHLMPFKPAGTPVSINQQPASITVNEGFSATFFVGVEAGTPPTFQWYKNGTAISGATLSFYTLDRAMMTDNGASFTVKLNGSIESSAATLTVIDDTAPPRVVLASTSLGKNVRIEFNELVDPPTAINKANYAIANITITDATLESDGRTVVLLITGSLPANFEVTLGGIADLAGNAIPAGTKVPGYTTGLQGNMVAYWPLDVVEGTKTPDIVNGYDMVLYNLTAADLVTGHAGKCLQFDASRSTYIKRVHAPEDPLPIYNHVAFTVSIWVNAPIQTDHRVYCESSSKANQPMFSIGTHQTGVASGLGSVDTYIRNNANTTSGDHHFHGIAYDDTWHHICYVQNSNASPQAVLYIDGVLDGVNPAPVWPQTIDTTTIGAIVRASAAAFFTGKIDDVAVWSRTLDADEVQFLFTKGTPTPPPKVLPLTISAFESDLTAAAQGDTVKLRWDVSKDATAIVIEPGVGDVMAQTKTGVGSTVVTMNQSKNFKLIVSRNEESISKELSVAAIGDVAANWSLLDNFDRYAVGGLPKPWGVSGPGVRVVDINGNRMLSVAGGDETLAGLPLNDLMVMEGQQRTLFTRFYLPQNVADSTMLQYMGLSDKGIRFYDDSDGELGPDVAFQNPGGNAQIGTWNGFGGAIELSDFAIQPGTPYNLWIDIRNDSIAEGDLFSVYVAKDGDATRTTLFSEYRSDRNPDPAESDLAGYPVRPDLRTLHVVGDTATSSVYFDDFYLSKSGYLSTVPHAYGFTTPISGESPKVSVAREGAVVTITFSGGTLESATSIAGTWQAVPGATPPSYQPTVTGQAFYRVKQ